MKQNIVEKIISIAKSISKEKGFDVSIAVTNDSGMLVGFLKMDSAPYGTIDVAIKKAKTAALFHCNSADLGKIANPSGPIYTIENTNGGLISFGGGVVISENNIVVGALGIAGATVEEDDMIAQETIKSL